MQLCMPDPNGTHFGGLSLEEFKKLRWWRTELSFDKTIFHPDSYRDIKGLIEYCGADEILLGHAKFQGYSPHSREFMPRLIVSMIKTRKFNAPIVCIRTNEGFKVLDGTHRLSAAFLLKDEITIPLAAWIGE